ncbi:MAG: sodium-dependent transporter [Candidatus Aenigmarchaeota archaeon]|nr:sodium-dependent transporter [Candidatus Aenigmarchaeota archaeon]
MPAKMIAREHWSKIGFLMAAIGSAVGLGNIWRFPYMVGSNGGGAFLIPYLIAVIAFGIPLMMMELDAGRRFKGSVVTTLKQINRKVWPLGVLAPIVSLSILSYYLVISGWTLGYFVFSITGYMEFSEFTNSLLPFFYFVITLAITAYIVSKGVKRGIETASMILMPILFIVLVALAVYALYLPGAAEGLAFYLTPDFSYLTDPNIWLMSISQAFFSLSVGYGILITYGSHLSKNTRIGRSVLGIAGADTLIAFIGGLIVFPIVFSFGLNPAEGTELSFIALPKVFSIMPFGMLIGFLFFFLLFTAALTSSISMLELGAANFIDELKWSRRKAVAFLSAIIFVVGIPSALSFYGSGVSFMGEPFIDFMDNSLGTLLMLSSALLCIAVIWFFRPAVFDVRNRILQKIRASSIMIFLLKYVIPIILFILFVIELLSGGGN